MIIDGREIDPGEVKEVGREAGWIVTIVFVVIGLICAIAAYDLTDENNFAFWIGFLVGFGPGYLLLLNTYVIRMKDKSRIKIKKRNVAPKEIEALNEEIAKLKREELKDKPVRRTLPLVAGAFGGLIILGGLIGIGVGAYERATGGTGPFDLSEIDFDGQIDAMFDQDRMDDVLGREQVTALISNGDIFWRPNMIAFS